MIMITETRESKDRHCSPDLELIRQLNEILAKDRKEIEALQSRSIGDHVRSSMKGKDIKQPTIIDTIKVMDATERVIDDTVTEAWLNGHASEFNEQVFSDRLRYQDEEERADYRERAYWANK